MGSPLVTAGYDRVIVIDTQVVLETKPLDQLSWQELGPGPILLLVCKQVQTEIDAKKNDGRLGKRARDFNRLLDGFLETRVPATLVTGTTRVDVALLANRRIDWDALDDLEQDNGDDRIVAQALNASVDDASRLEILSHDLRPRNGAVTHGMRAIKLKEDWLRDPEPTSEDRVRARLKAELRVLRAEQPEIDIAITPERPGPWTRTTIEPASADQVHAIESALHRTAPVVLGRAAFGDHFDFTFDRFDEDHTLRDRLATWRRRLRESDLPNMHRGIARLYAQHRVRVEIRNTGHVPAQGLSLEIRSGNAVLHTLPYAVLIFGKAPPQARSRMFTPFHSPNLADFQSGARSEPFAFYQDEEGPGALVSWSCASFRQEKSFAVDVSVEIEDRTGPTAQIEVVVTAENMKGDKRAQTLVPIVDRSIAFDEAVDIDRRSLIGPLPFVLAPDTKANDCRIYRNDGSKV